MKKKEFLPYKIYILGLIVFSLISILVLIRDIYIFKDYNLFFWFCDFIPFFILIALVLKNEDMMNGIINSGIIVQSVYLFTVLSHYLRFGAPDVRMDMYFGAHLPNLNPWSLNIGVIPLPDLFSQRPLLILIGIFIHLGVVFAFSMFFRRISSKKSLMWSFLTLCLMFFPALFFTPLNRNINQIIQYNNLERLFPLYTQLWIFWVFLIIVIPTYFLRNYLASRLISSNKK